MNVDTCRLPYVYTLFTLQDICFKGQNVEKNFSVKCFLPASYVVALGLAVSLELFAIRAYVVSYHACHIHPRPVFLRR